MNLTSLKYLQTIVKQRSFIKAANVISISHQGLSKAIKKLEDELGLELLTRSGKQIVLSDEGKALYPAIEKVLESCAAFQDAVVQIRRNKTAHENRLQILSMPFVIVRVFRAIDEEISARGLGHAAIIEDTLANIITRVKERPQNSIAMVNILAGHQDNMLDDDSICFDPLFAIATVVAASPQLISPRTNILTLKELQKLPIVYHSSKDMHESANLLFAQYKPSNLITRISDVEHIARMVELGRAAYITDNFSAQLLKDNSSFMFFSLDKPIYWNVGLLHSRDIEKNTVEWRYLEAIREIVRHKWSSFLNRNPPR